MLEARLTKLLSILILVELNDLSPKIILKRKCQDTVSFGCLNVSLKDAVEAVTNGTDTVEKVAEITGACTDCGRCKALVKNLQSIRR